MNILQLKGISKSFDGVNAVKNLDLSITQGLVTALIGPNGAGKTTVFNLITGFLNSSTGNIYFNEQNITRMQPNYIARLGLSRTFQNIRIFPQLTVLENIMVALSSNNNETLLTAILQTKRMKSEEISNHKKALQALEKVGLLEKQHQLADDMSYGQRKLLEIARTLAQQPKLLLLDEPMAGLSPNRIIQMKQIIKSLKEEGQSILFIEHNMKVVMEISDHIIVLDHGINLAEGNPLEVQNNKQVITAYFGKEKNVT
jgi:ABC-type branched-subunit amino acid transport system ATPase component